MTTIRLGPTILKQLIQRGLPRDILRNHPFEVDGHTYTFASTVEGLKTIRIAKKLQLEHLDHVLSKPFGRPYLYIISSTPNDAKAKQTAAFIMERATIGQLGGKYPRSTRGKTSPRWHMVNGSFRDSLRDNDTDNPSMLVISNVTTTSTNVKIEKVRDLLEQFSSIPRILVISGEDPISFANSKLFLSVNHVLNLGTAKKTVL